MDLNLTSNWHICQVLDYIFSGGKMPKRPKPCFKTAEVVWHKASLVFLVIPSALSTGHCS